VAIDLNSEEVISLTEATKLLPRRRGGKRPHVSCLYRWTTVGCRGVVLESLQAGGTRCTSCQALSRFCQRLTEAAGISDSVASSVDEQSAQQAEEQLDAAGIGDSLPRGTCRPEANKGPQDTFPGRTKLEPA